MHRPDLTDRRVQKTRASLRDALASLIHEKPYEAIAVQEILDRANVGRSTFYAHFRDKDDLLAAGIDAMLHALPPPARSRSAAWYERIVWFSLPVFEYHEARRHRSGDRTAAAGKAALHGHLQRALTETIGEAVRAEYRTRRKAPRIDAEVLVPYLAATFGAVFDWWLASAHPSSAHDADRLFRTLVVPTLATLDP